MSGNRPSEVNLRGQRDQRILKKSPEKFLLALHTFPRRFRAVARDRQANHSDHEPAAGRHNIRDMDTIAQMQLIAKNLDQKRLPYATLIT